MRKLTFIFALLSLIAFGIAVYQFVDSRMFDSTLSIIYGVCFVTGAWYNRRQVKKRDNVKIIY